MKKAGAIGVTVITLAILACACGRRKDEPKPFPTDTLPVDAIARVNEICARLVKAGVAKNCVSATEPPPSKLHSRLLWTATFDAVGGFPKSKCNASVYPDDKAYKDLTSMYSDVPSDDFPRSLVSSTDAAMWRASVACESSDKWDACRDKEKIAVSACAKRFPAEYARYRAVHDAAVRIVDGR